MSDDDARRCDRHTCVALGVTTVDGSMTRVWICENCPVWTRQLLDDRFEIDWEDAGVPTS